MTARARVLSALARGRIHSLQQGARRSQTEKSPSRTAASRMGQHLRPKGRKRKMPGSFLPGIADDDGKTGGLPRCSQEYKIFTP